MKQANGKRKDKKKESAIEIQSVRVYPETYTEVKAYCEENGMKIGWFYNQAAKLYLLELNEKATA